MVSEAEFRKLLLVEDVDTLVDQFYFRRPSAHVDDAAKEQIASYIADRYSLSLPDLRLHVTGSAHLGFSIVEKKTEGLPRYRAFSAESDIDCAIVSARLYSLIWDEVATHAHRLTPWPHPLNGLGTYMIYGWLRPDKFPKGLYQCDRWWSSFAELSRRRVVGRHRVNGGLFYSTAHLKRYVARAVLECKVLEELS